MKKAKATKVLLLMTIASACLCFAVSKVNGDGDTRLYKLAKDESVTEIHLENSYGTMNFYRNDAGDWVVREKAEYLAENTKMKLMLESLVDFNISRTMETSSSEYGLDEAEISVSFSTSKGKKHTFEVGNQTMTHNDVYVKDLDQNKVVIAGLDDVAQLGGGIDSFRSKEIFRVDMNNLSQITWKNSQNSDLILQKDQEVWFMTEPYQAPAREIELQELLAAMKDWNVCAFADAMNYSTEKMGLTGERILKLQDASGMVQELEIGKPVNGTIAVRTGGENNILILYADEVDLSVLEADKLLFYAPLKADITSLQTIQIRIEGKEYEIGIDAENEIFTCNGKMLDKEKFYSFFVSYMGMNASGGIGENESDSGDVVAELKSTFKDGSSMVLTLTGRDEATSTMWVNNSESGFYLNNEKLVILYDKLTAISDY